MKKVQAEVRKERFPEVDAALKVIGVPGVTVVDEPRAGRGMWDYPNGCVKRVLLTVVVDDRSVRRVVESICGSGSTRSWGDGRVSVSPVENVLDIGSGNCDRSEMAAPLIGA